MNYNYYTLYIYKYYKYIKIIKRIKTDHTIVPKIKIYPNTKFDSNPIRDILHIIYTSTL